MPKIGQNDQIVLHMLPQKPKNNRNAEIGTNIAHGVRMMPEHFVSQ